MTFRRVILVFGLLWCHSGLAQTPVAPDVSQIRALVEKARADWNVPGLSVAIVRDGQVVLAEGFGVRELGKPETVDGDTVFAIASNTKAFTAAALAILQEEGKIQWADPVQKSLPWLQLYDPYVSADLCIDDLLCHRSGLGTFSGDLLWWGTPYSPEEVLRRTKYLPAKGRYREHYGYSNLMFLAAGEVVRNVSGKSWPDYIQEKILTPVGMSRTVTSVKSLESLGNHATPHKPTPDKVSPIAWYNWDTMAAAGGIISSANDMAKWVRVQLDRGRIDADHRLFSEASSRKMWSPHTIIPFSEAAQRRSPTTHFRAYGLGWSLADYKGRMTVSHGGGYDGMYSHVLLIPEEKLGIVVLTNSMTGISTALTNTIVDRFLGGAETDWLTAGLERDRNDRAAFYKRIGEATTPKVLGTQPSHDREACTGTFRCPLYGDATVRLEEDKLVLRLLPNSELVADLEHLHYDTWVIHWRKEFAWFAEGTIQFVPDASGTFQELRLDVPNDDLWFDELQLKRVK
jgi:CubicO group peptidase (beta-lactamase class C family)